MVEPLAAPGSLLRRRCPRDREPDRGISRAHRYLGGPSAVGMRLELDSKSSVAMALDVLARSMHDAEVVGVRAGDDDGLGRAGEFF